MPAHAFVDESKVNGLVMVAALVGESDLSATRAAMRALCMPRQSRLHFTKERPSRRRQIVEAVRTGQPEILIFDAREVRDARTARAMALERLVEDLSEIPSRRLIIERDDSQAANDRRVLFDAVRKHGLISSLSYELVPARSEPILWMADAAAWCWTHRGEWRAAIAPLVCREHRL